MQLKIIYQNPPMRKLKLLLLSIFIAPALLAQVSFEQILPPPPAPQIIPKLEGVAYSSVAFADVDGNDTEDVFISGNSQSSDGLISKLYINDGLGNFTEKEGTPFDGVTFSSVAFSDVDGSGSEDLLISGRLESGLFSVKLYINDGLGNFTELVGTPFEGAVDGSVAFADVDGNGSKDVLIIGSYSSNLYLNDGEGNFTKLTETPFLTVSENSIVFLDVDGNGTEDVLITGSNDSNLAISKLYTNDGQGNFTEVEETPIEDVLGGSVAVSDVDGNGTEDVLITGLNAFFQEITKLYLNDGQGNFTEVVETPFDEVHASSVAFSDVDGNGTEDVFITGRLASGFYSAKLYVNDGSGKFTEGFDTSFEGVIRSSIAFSDVDNDGSVDLLVTGQLLASNYISELYLNNGIGNFAKATGTVFDGVAFGSIAFSDVDGNGTEDVLITGVNSSFQSIANSRIAKLYLNDGSGNFNEVTGTPFEGVESSSIAFSDVDGNGAEDLLITGRTDSFRIARLYLNDGSGNFSQVVDPFTGVYEGFIAFQVSFEQILPPNPVPQIIPKFAELRDGLVAFADIDGNGTEDMLMTGKNASNVLLSILYTNDGAGNFTEFSRESIKGLQNSSVAFSDVDGNGSQDLLIIGEISYDDAEAKLYLNDGSGNFTEETGFSIEDIFNSAIAFSDVDGNGSQDLLITGKNSLDNYVALLYLNDGSGNFTEATDTPFRGVAAGSIAFSDVDGNGTEDVIIIGYAGFLDRSLTKLYINDGSGNFTEVVESPFQDVSDGSIAFSDVDGNGTQDVLLSGLDGSGGAVTKLYANDGIGNFNEVAGVPFESSYYGSISFSDVDGNGSQDVLITGAGSSSGLIAKLYINDGAGNFFERSGTSFRRSSTRLGSIF